ncbi:MAG: hypothetical protein KC421_10835 [Anaerolineales bacterium]|nr:hypothetical protein [Anaerolineales bacterium]
MDTTTLKKKAKETKDQAVDFVRSHWKEILLWSAITAGTVWYLSSERNDEENIYLYDEDGHNIDSKSYVEIGDSRDSQTNLQKDRPKRFIGGIDATGSRLKKNEKQFLEEFSTQYDRFSGLNQTLESKHDSWCSDGKYTRFTKTKHSFGDDKMSITVDESYKDDDGQTGSSSLPVELKARNVINYVRENRDLKMFDDVRDIVDIL